MEAELISSKRTTDMDAREKRQRVVENNRRIKQLETQASLLLDEAKALRAENCDLFCGDKESERGFVAWARRLARRQKQWTDHRKS
jgi:hypothetical protein